MMVKAATAQAGATAGDSARPGAAQEAPQPSRLDGLVRNGIWFAVVTRGLGDHRFLANVITKAIGAYALASVIKGNQARPVRRVIRWYNIKAKSTA